MDQDKINEYYSNEIEKNRLDLDYFKLEGIRTKEIIARFLKTKNLKIVDVGGGNGTLISAILNTYPETVATLMDLGPVIEHAKRQLAGAGLTNRCEFVAGDFFQAVPAGGDAYILSTVICNWDEERAIIILKNCHRAMTKGSKLLLVEIVLPPGDAPSPGKMLDLQMMIITGGRDRTEAEYRTLLEAAGFTLAQVVPTPSERSVIEATPA